MGCVGQVIPQSPQVTSHLLVVVFIVLEFLQFSEDAVFTVAVGVVNLISSKNELDTVARVRWGSRFCMKQIHQVNSEHPHHHYTLILHHFQH